MDEKVNVSKQAEEVLRQKLEELEVLDASSEEAKNAAEVVAKQADTLVKLRQDDRSKKDWIWKGLAFLGGIATAAVAAVIKGVCDMKIAEKQIDYLEFEHGRAYDWEANGDVEHIVTSPAAKDSLRERPKLK